MCYGSKVVLQEWAMVSSGLINRFMIILGMRLFRYPKGQAIDKILLLDDFTGTTYERSVISSGQHVAMPVLR
jgi:hypothetical protein